MEGKKVMADKIMLDLTEEDINKMGSAERNTALVKLAFATYRILNGNGDEGLCKVVTRHERDLISIQKTVWFILFAIVGAGITAIWAGTR